jgi:hypothetical protein
MLGKIIKYFVFGLIGLIVLVALIASPFVIRARMEGERLYARYDSYTREVLSKNFQLEPFPIKPEFQIVNPWKALKLLNFVARSEQTDRLARINSLDATMAVFMKMYTLLLRPAYEYNLPMMSVDIIFMGASRVFVIEIIDPARIDDENKKLHYDKMRAWQPEVAKLEPMKINMAWCKDIVTDFSVHVKADRARDDMLFEIYKTFLNAYIDMAKNAQPLSAEQSAKVKEGIEGYVSALLAKGGPAVDVFKQILGPEGQRAYVRSVMFGVD